MVIDISIKLDSDDVSFSMHESVPPSNFKETNGLLQMKYAEL